MTGVSSLVAALSLAAVGAGLATDQVKVCAVASPPASVAVTVTE